MSIFNKKSKSEIQQDEEKQRLLGKVKYMYNNAYNAKAAINKKMDMCYQAYKGDYIKQKLSNTQLKTVNNFVFSTVETIKPIILADNPKILVLPQSEDMQEKSDSVQKGMDYEWQREKMFIKTLEIVHDALVLGTGIMGVLWDGVGAGNVKAIRISPFNFFVDPAATSLEEAEYCGYAVYKSYGELSKIFPDFKEQLKLEQSTQNDTFLSYGKEENNNTNQILYLEFYFRDYSTELTDDVDEDGNKVERYKYPNGRHIIVAGDTILVDDENPYRDGKFPFEVLRCYSIPGEFWGMSEVEQIISPTIYTNEINNTIVESAQLMSNPIWVLDKNCGVAKNSLTNRRGLVIRKNPGTEVRRDAPPSLPAYLQNIITDGKANIENISGVYDVTRGERPGGITAASAIQALNEQAQGRIKLKVQQLEDFLSRVGGLWLSRMQQFWVTRRYVRVMGTDYKPSFDLINKDDIDGDFDIQIVAGSTMPVNKTARLQQLITLAQTPAEDGLPMVDRQTLLENADLSNLQQILQRFADIKQQKMQEQQAQQQQQLQMQQQQMQMKQQQDMQMEQMRANLEVQKNGQINQQNADLQQQQEGQNNQMSPDLMAFIAGLPTNVIMELNKLNPQFNEILKQAVQGEQQNQNVNNQGNLNSQGGM